MWVQLDQPRKSLDSLLSSKSFRYLKLARILCQLPFFKKCILHCFLYTILGFRLKSKVVPGVPSGLISSIFPGSNLPALLEIRYAASVSLLWLRTENPRNVHMEKWTNNTPLGAVLMRAWWPLLFAMAGGWPSGDGRCIWWYYKFCSYFQEQRPLSIDIAKVWLWSPNYSSHFKTSKAAMMGE